MRINLLWEDIVVFCFSWIVIPSFSYFNVVAHPVLTVAVIKCLLDACNDHIRHNIGIEL